jgi:hypothetical protein
VPRILLALSHRDEPAAELEGPVVSAHAGVKLRNFYDDFKAGKRPIMLLMTPPQHGKSLSVIDFMS